MGLILRIIWSIWAIPWFGLTTIVFSTIVIVSSLLGASPRFIELFPRTWGKVTLAGLLCFVKVHGRENLTEGQPYVFASNHSSALDILVLFKALPKNFRWIAKKELFAIPLFGKAITVAGYIPIDRSNRRAAMQSLQTASDRIRAGASVVIFPEGTRSPTGQMGEFKSGGFLLALKAEQPVVPVLIKGIFQILPTHTFLLRPGRVQVYIGQPMATQGLPINQRDQLAAQVREKVVNLAQP